MKSSLRLLSLALVASATVAASAKVTEKFAQTYPLAANGTIRLENINGTVEIIAWDKAEVSLEAEKSARDEDALKRMNIKITATADKLAIKTEHERTWKFWDNANAQVYYKLMVPAGVSLDKISVVNANIHVSGIKGSVELKTVNGSIDARDLSGPGEFDTVNGSIVVAYSSLPAPADKISLDTVNGSCTLKLPANAGFVLDADTVNGRVSCDFPITLAKSGKHDLRGTVGSGGPMIELDSVNGSLTVAKVE
jgi:hypothetical protein